MPPARGEIWDVDYEPRAQARAFERAGRCPALIISSDRLNARGYSCIVIPISSTPRRLPWYVLVPAGGALPRPGVALCDQVRAIAQSRLLRRRGSLTAGQVQAVVARLLNTIA